MGGKSRTDAKRCRIGYEEDNGACDFLGVAKRFENARGELSLNPVRSLVGFDHLGLHRTGCNGVDADTVVGQFPAAALVSPNAPTFAAL
jgi:hypothetical protein